MSISDSFAIFVIFLKYCYILNYYSSNDHQLQLFLEGMMNDNVNLNKNLKLLLHLHLLFIQEIDKPLKKNYPTRQ